MCNRTGVGEILGNCQRKNLFGEYCFFLILFFSSTGVYEPSIGIIFLMVQFWYTALRYYSVVTVMFHYYSVYCSCLLYTSDAADE